MAVVLAATGLFLYLRLGDELQSSLDTSLRSRADEVSALVRPGGAPLSARGGERLVEADESFAQVIAPNGEVLDGTPPLDRTTVLTRAQLREAQRGPVFFDRDSEGTLDDPVRVLALPAERGGERVVVVVAGTRDDRNEALASLRTQLFVGGPVALLLAALAGYGLATAALRPVESMRREAAEISRLGSGRSLPVPEARDELAELGETLNEMLARLERSVERERSFIANASHELRTPLTLLRGELELALRAGRSPAELRAAVGSAAEETERLVQLTEDLLVLARSDEEGLPLRREPLELGELLGGVARRFEHRAAKEGRELRVESPGDLRLRLDRLRAEQALGNMVENALRHGAGPVELGAERVDGTVRVHVRDHGPGFPDGLLDSAFERFTRADGARSRGGTGLGLAIVDAIARAHDGRAGAANRPDGGAEVWIELDILPGP